MKNWVVHYKNKYPGCIVQSSDAALDVFLGEDHLVSIQKNGAGQWADQSEGMGLAERHDLSPLPKDARVHKVVDGKVGLDERHEERREARAKFMDGGKVLSIEELQKKGFRFDQAGNCQSEPQAQVKA